MNWEEAVIWLRNQKGQEDLVKACFFDDPLAEAARRYWKSSEWKAIKKYLPSKPGKVLDIGAGRGISSFAFAKDGWKVTALEPDSSMLVGAGAIEKLAQDAKLDIAVNKDWGERLKFPDGSFDVVFGRQVLHHAKDLGILCKEMSRVLKKGGLFMAVREHVISQKDDLPIFLDNHPLHKLYGGENAYLLKEYKKAIENANIKLIHILNPLESDINLFPETKRSFKIKIFKNFTVSPLKYMPSMFIRTLGNRINHPGRVYSFIGKKI